MDYSRISEERKKLGWSQEELANKVGVSQKVLVNMSVEQEDLPTKHLL